MTYATMADRNAIENEAAWAARDLPVTTYAMLAGTAARHAARPAVSFQLLSDPASKKETLTWRELHDKTCQTANLFRSLGVGEDDV